MSSIENISIGILVTKNGCRTEKDSLKEKKESQDERNIVFVNIEAHKKFVKNIFSLLESSRERVILK